MCFLNLVNSISNLMVGNMLSVLINMFNIGVFCFYVFFVLLYIYSFN